MNVDLCCLPGRRFPRMAASNSGTSLSLVTGTGASSAITSVSHHAAAIVVSGFSGGATVTLEGSRDDTSWFTLSEAGTLRFGGNGA